MTNGERNRAELNVLERRRELEAAVADLGRRLSPRTRIAERIARQPTAWVAGALAAGILLGLHSRH